MDGCPTVGASYAAPGCSKKGDDVNTAGGGGDVEGKIEGGGIDLSTSIEKGGDGIGATGGDGESEGGAMVIPMGGRVGTDGENRGDEVRVVGGRGVEEEGGQVGSGASGGGTGEEEGCLEGVVRVEEGVEDVRTNEGDWEGSVTEDGKGGGVPGEKAEEGRADKEGVR